MLFDLTFHIMDLSQQLKVWHVIYDIYWFKTWIWWDVEMLAWPTHKKSGHKNIEDMSVNVSLCKIFNFILIICFRTFILLHLFWLYWVVAHLLLSNCNRLACLLMIACLRKKPYTTCTWCSYAILPLSLPCFSKTSNLWSESSKIIHNIWNSGRWDFIFYCLSACFWWDRSTVLVRLTLVGLSLKDVS